MKRTVLTILGCIVLAVAGVVAAAAATDNTGTVSACAQATAGDHTIAVDGADVATLPGDTESQCVTTTYTIPTVTVTVVKDDSFQTSLQHGSITLPYAWTF